MQILYHGQYKQDMIVDILINYLNVKPGIKTFLDIGANDGISLSNTYFLEKHRNWIGICVEPIPSIYSKLVENRPNSACFNCLVGSESASQIPFLHIIGEHEMCSGKLDTYHPKHIQRINSTNSTCNQLNLQQRTLNEIIIQSNIGCTHFDFLSLDTEGSEYDILKSIDFSTYSFGIIL